jgi:hypothetical protein
MENNNVLESQWDNTPKSMKDKRGAFLLVICILSWAYMGYVIISTSITYFNGIGQLEEQMAVSMELFEQETGNPLLNSIMEDTQMVFVNTLKYFKEIQIGNIMALFFGALSVYLMYSLKKIGFYLYILYSIIIPSIQIYFLGSSMVIIAIVAFSGIVGIAFIIMYGVNLKRMTE